MIRLLLPKRCSVKKYGSMQDRIIAGQIIFVSLLVTLSVLRIVLAKPLMKMQWFIDNALKLSLWTLVWGVTVSIGSQIFDLRGPVVNYVAVGPTLSILIALFLLVLIEVPAFWYKEVLKIVRFFRNR